MCDETINATNSASTNVTNAIPTNMTNTIPTNATRIVSINSDMINSDKLSYKYVRYTMGCHIFSLVIMLLFIIAIVSYHFTKPRSKQMYWRTNNIKLENNEF